MKTLSRLLVVGLALALLSGCGGEKTKGEKKVDAPAIEPVRMDLHIMSKNAFGVKVVSTMIPVLEQMGDAVDFRIHYIGRDQNGDLKSMHGEPEIKGNLLQICAREKGDTSQWLSFLKCQNAQWRNIPEGWEACATAAKLDVSAMKSCSEGDEGKSKLAASFALSQEKKAIGSPTIFLNDKAYTGGRTESAFGRAICAQFSGTRPEYCAGIPEPVKVPITVVTDERCKVRTCNPRRFVSFVRNNFEGAEIEMVDYMTPEGKALFEKSGQKYLPIAVFGASVAKVDGGFNRLKKRFEKMDNGDFVYPLGNQGRPLWDPTAEICDDGQDNTGNGLVDCEDEGCQVKKACRPETKNRVDLFVMSQCPFGVRTVDALVPVIEHFGKDPEAFNVNIQFVGEERDGKFTSLHGDNEVQENIRQLCAQKYYAKGFKFMEYITCRNEAFEETQGREEPGAWEACAKAGIAPPVIRKCAEGEEGTALLSASFQLAGELEFRGSPSWLLNNRHDMRARSAQQIKQSFCDKNQENPKCQEEMVVDPSKAQPAVPAGSCGGGPAPARKSFKAATPPAAAPAAAKPAGPPAKPAAPSVQ